MRKGQGERNKEQHFSRLKNPNLPIPMYWDREIFKTTVSPHSEILKCHWNNDKECNC